MKFTLKNDFHNTAYTLHTELGRELSSDQIRRARKALCGMSDCKCGGNLNERGPQPVDVVADGYKDDLKSLRIYLAAHQKYI